MFASVETPQPPSSDAGRSDHPHGKKSYTQLTFPLPPVVLLCVSEKVLALSVLSKVLREALLAAFTSFSSSISSWTLTFLTPCVLGQHLNLFFVPSSIIYRLCFAFELAEEFSVSHAGLLPPLLDVVHVGIDYYFFWGDCGLEIKQLLSPFAFQGSLPGILKSKSQNDLKSALLGSKQSLCYVFLILLRSLKSWMFILSYSPWLRFLLTFTSLTTSWCFLNNRLSRTFSLVGLSIS